MAFRQKDVHGSHSSSGSGDEGFVYVKQPGLTPAGEQAKAIDEIGSEVNRLADQERASKELPATQYKGEVNWLGSSYSGQDIKVVAHLYGSAKDTTSKKEEFLNDQLDFYESMKSGANNLAAGNTLVDIAANTNTFDDRVQAFDTATGLTNAGPPTVGQQRALRELRSQVLASGDFESFIGLAKAKVQLESIAQSAEIGAEATKKELDNIQNAKLQGSSTLTLGSLQTISIQSYREKFGVRAIGHSYVKGYTRGPRTLAGSMIFTVFQEHPLYKLIAAMGGTEEIWRDPEISHLIPDQLPPIDLTLVFANEYGALSRLNIYGVEFMNDGVTFSIDNLLSEQVVSFVARDVDIMTDVGNVRLSKLQRGQGIEDLRGSALLGGDDYIKYLDKLRVRRRLTNR